MTAQKVAAILLENELPIHDYSLDDLLFAHWLRRKRELLRDNRPVPAWLEQQLDRLRPRRNPNASVFILDRPYQ